MPHQLINEQEHMINKLKLIASDDPIDLTVDDCANATTMYTKETALSKAWSNNLVGNISMNYLDKPNTIKVVTGTLGTTFNNRNHLYWHILEKEVIFCPILDSGH